MDWMESVLGEAGPHGGGAVLGFESQFVEVGDGKTVTHLAVNF